jgi:hypothetical protein
LTANKLRPSVIISLSGLDCKLETVIAYKGLKLCSCSAELVSQRKNDGESLVSFLATTIAHIAKQVAGVRCCSCTLSISSLSSLRVDSAH